MEGRHAVHLLVMITVPREGSDDTAASLRENETVQKAYLGIE